MLQGWKTLLFGIAMAVGPQVLNLLGTFDFTTLGLSPNAASIVGVIVIALRTVTTGPMFQKKAVLAYGLIATSLAVAACTQTQLDKTQQYQAMIGGACQMAMPLAGSIPSVGVYVQAACSTEQAIAKLALDPSSLQWLQGLIAQLKGSA